MGDATSERRSGARAFNVCLFLPVIIAAWMYAGIAGQSREHLGGSSPLWVGLLAYSPLVVLAVAPVLGLALMKNHWWMFVRSALGSGQRSEAPFPQRSKALSTRTISACCASTSREAPRRRAAASR